MFSFLCPISSQYLVGETISSVVLAKEPLIEHAPYLNPIISESVLPGSTNKALHWLLTSTLTKALPLLSIPKSAQKQITISTYNEFHATVSKLASDNDFFSAWTRAAKKYFEIGYDKFGDSEELRIVIKNLQPMLDLLPQEPEILLTETICKKVLVYDGKNCINC